MHCIKLKNPYSIHQISHPSSPILFTVVLMVVALFVVALMTVVVFTGVGCVTEKVIVQTALMNGSVDRPLLSQRESASDIRKYLNHRRVA